MSTLMRYNSNDLPTLMDKINRNSIGLDEYIDRLFNLHETTSNYPPYNLVQTSNIESRIEIALSGFKKEEIKVYTEHGKLYIEGQKEDKESSETYIHKGLAQRSFKRTWVISDESEVEDVHFEDGLLTVKLKKVVPDHYIRKDYI